MMINYPSIVRKPAPGFKEKTEVTLKDDNDILNAVFSQLGDSYEYKEKLGEGATSKVYLVYHKHLKQNRALKIMDYEYIKQSLAKGKVADSTIEFDQKKKRFINEAKLYTDIKHPNIAEIYDIRVVKAQQEGIEIPYIIMQYVEGEPLSHLLKNKIPLKLETAAAISVNILDALGAIHQKPIIHRDIKPSNIMIEKGTGKAIIIDFGLAKDLLEGSHITSTGMQMGTYLYMSPEQFIDSGKVGPEADIYSFGVILYEMLTGKLPYEGHGLELMYKHISGKIPDIKKENKDLPDAIDILIRKALSKEGKNRGNAHYYKEKLEIFIKKKGPVEVKAEKIRNPVLKIRITKRVAYAAVFIFIVMISYFLYLYFNKTTGETVNGRNSQAVKVSTSTPTSPAYQIKQSRPSPGDDKKKSGGEGNKSGPEEGKNEIGPGKNEGSSNISAVASPNPQNAPIGYVDNSETNVIPLKQPDPVYYSMKRDELLNCSKKQMSTFPIPWIAACAREGTVIYNDASLKGKGFQTAYLQRFEVLDKSGDKLKLKELGKPKPGTGWTSMRNLIYLPQALKDKRTSVYQKVIFTHIEDRLEPGKIGDITFFKRPGSYQPGNTLETRALGSFPIAYVYAWENNDYEDSQWVLLSDYPSIESVSKDENAFKKTIYGWCKTAKLFPWSSRMALIPNKDKNARVYIFKDGPSLTNFYSKASATFVPDPDDLLTFDAYKMWLDSNWPFFLGEKLNSHNLDYIRLVCLVDSMQARGPDERRQKRTYIMKFGYAVEKDPRIRGLNQFKNVYLFRKSEINKIINDLDTTLSLLRPLKINGLWKEFTERVCGEEYVRYKTINDYAQKNDGITYKELSVLFDKTQEQINSLDMNELEQIKEKILAVKRRLEDIINDKANERAFGSSEDPYIWLYENELP